VTRPNKRTAPDLPTIVSLGLLAVVALLLLAPLLGLGRPPVWLLAALLLIRLGVQFWRSRRAGAGRASGGWLLDLVLIGLLIYVGLGQK
jgi:hypothetical protein